MRLFKEFDWRKLDFIMIGIMCILLIIGVFCLRQEDIMSGGTSGLYKRQLFGVGVGLVLFLFLVIVDYRILCRNSYLFYIGIVGLLAYTILFGHAINNVKRWVRVAGIQLQPSELAKTVLILFLAFLCDYFREEMDRYRTLFVLGAAISIPLILILLEPHLSTTLVIIFVSGVMVLMSGFSYRIIAKVCAVIVPCFIGIIVAVGVYNVNLPFIKPYQVKRVLTYFSHDESQDASGKYQQNQALTAIASGGTTGKIINDETPHARAFSGIYANESDFVFSIVGEEFGFLGSAVILLLYFVMVARCLYIANNAFDYVGQLICIGVSAMLMFQTFVNVGVATSILPNTGLPLPFISYGLTSLVNSIAAVALVVNVSLRSRL